MAAFGTAQAAAPAAVPQGTISFDYNYSDYGSGVHLDQIGGGGSAVLPLGSSPFSVQIDGGYHNLTLRGSSGNVTDGDVDGAISWRLPKGRAGLTVGYDAKTLAGTTLNFTNYGVYGEWYPIAPVTLGVKGGGVTLSAGGSTTGVYAGGEIVGYAMPNLALSASVDYTGFNGLSFSGGGVKAEYLVSQSIPISVFAGYTYTNIQSFGGIQSNTFSIGAKYYFGARGSTLVEHHRDGADNWGPSSIGQSLGFFF